MPVTGHILPGFSYVNDVIALQLGENPGSSFLLFLCMIYNTIVKYIVLHIIDNIVIMLILINIKLMCILGTNILLYVIYHITDNII